MDDGQAVDPGVGGVLVTLLDAQGGEVGTTTTAADGTYSFGGLAAGDYTVQFTDPNGVLAGKELVADNVGGDDSIDSDAIGNTTLSEITSITVVAGQNTPDNDAGVVELPGSLSGRYFCDEDRDGLDNDGPNNGVAGISVELLDSNGVGTGITTTTDANGDYSFDGLAAGTYGVEFTDPNGVVVDKFLTTQNADNDASDDIDSDAAGDNVTSSIQGITVVAGQDTPDNDAGVFPNEDPTVTNDMGMGCADELIFVDLADNYADADSSSVSITGLNGVAIGDGETVTIDGVEVTRNGDTFAFDGETAYASLGLGQQATQSFTFDVVDSDGATASGTVDVSFCGYASVETV